MLKRIKTDKLFFVLDIFRKAGFYRKDYPRVIKDLNFGVQRPGLVLTAVDALNSQAICILKEKTGGVKMKYSVCSETVFEGVDILDAMKTIKKCGYDAVEFWFWWERDVDAIAKASRELNLEVAAICAPFGKPGDLSTHDSYVADLQKTFEAADKMGCDKIIVQGGWIDDASPDGVHRKNMIRLFKRIAPMAQKANKMLIVEPLNKKVNHPSYYLDKSRDAFDIIDIVGSPNLKVLFDIYHQQITEGNLIENITENIDKIGHFHMAGNPGRNDIYRGEINYANILRAIKDCGYTGYAGLEYFPVDPVEESLIRTKKEVLI